MHEEDEKMKELISSISCGEKENKNFVEEDLLTVMEQMKSNLTMM